MKSTRFFVMLSLAVAVVACSPSAKKSTNENSLEAFSAKLDSISPSLLQPSQVAAILQVSDVRYNSAWVNDPLKWENYKSDSLLCAANIGIYLADALYQYATEDKGGKFMKEGMYSSIAAATALAQSVGMESVFQGLVIERYEAGTIAADSIVSSIDMAFAASHDKAKETSSMRFFMAMAIGNYIEKNYLLLNSVFDNPENLPADVKLALDRQLILMLKHQLELGNELVAMADKLLTNDDPGVVVAKYKELNAVFATADFSFENVNAIDPTAFFQNPKLLETFRLVKEMREFITK
jgi:hypothetical protein